MGLLQEHHDALLDPEKRAQIGAHYTSREDIETLLRPVLLGPLRREWEEARARAAKLWARLSFAGKPPESVFQFQLGMF